MREARRGETTSCAAPCGTTSGGNGSSPPATKKRYHYYSCHRRKVAYDKRTRTYHLPIWPSLGFARGQYFGRYTALHLERYYEKEGPNARIMALVVGSEHRDRGVGRALISAAEVWAKQRGAKDVRLTTHKRRAGAH